MKAITLRNLPAELAKTIEQESLQKGTSLNKTIIRLLEEALLRSKSNKKEILHHDLDELAGTWSQEDADKFDNACNANRTIDEELWK